MINVTELIRILLVKRDNISESELARRLNTSPQNLSQKMKRNNWTVKDLEQIAEAVGCKLLIDFVPDQPSKDQRSAIRTEQPAI